MLPYIVNLSVSDEAEEVKIRRASEATPVNVLKRNVTTRNCEDITLLRKKTINESNIVT